MTGRNGSGRSGTAATAENTVPLALSAPGDGGHGRSARYPHSGHYLEYDNVCLRTHEPTPLVLFHTDARAGPFGRRSQSGSPRASAQRRLQDYQSNSKMSAVRP